MIILKSLNKKLVQLPVLPRDNEQVSRPWSSRARSRFIHGSRPTCGKGRQPVLIISLCGAARLIASPAAIESPPILSHRCAWPMPAGTVVARTKGTWIAGLERCHPSFGGDPVRMSLLIQVAQHGRCAASVVRALRYSRDPAVGEELYEVQDALAPLP